MQHKYIYLIIFIIFFVILLIVYDKRNLQLFDHFYEGMVTKHYLKYNKFFKTPEYLYTQLNGYENGRKVDELVQTLEKKDIAFAVSEQQFGKLKDKSANKSVVNSFILGDIHNYNKDDKNIARIHYSNTLNRLNNYSNEIIKNNDNTIEPSPEHMINRIETFYIDENIIQIFNSGYNI